ncbi:patatin-like phospholipase family protein [Bifidobacterium psychraerophilum]|jgi:predicted patatin/cPLA2 family phospholipase|uniref:patatin-like phospholipase family protein n=1 Tax=Bifidobacterium psychraerophilum TaxID=218140 RepID=UPI0023F21D6F|nr:patatin family protein [Bifidobacterium psychraerophilum]MCI1804853.1 patatin family protein [Bifidobacterium psychraerophilum]MCI2176811.1 patatin family protein [Bifidobacterium psychraerophilum]MCI2182603.1 patatin family protein [Bifidobacterium psychraerophilum]
MSKTAIIDVGGGYRAIFGAGVFDYCADHDLSFDHCYGVSAGSANLASFMAHQPGRTYRFYTQYAFRKEYASSRNFMRERNFVDLDYVYGTLSNHDGEDPMDFEAFERNPSDLTVVACNALDGSTKYFGKQDVSRDDYDIFKASSAVPVACEPYVIDGVPYFDGGICDPVPVQKAFDDGCDKVVLVLTRLKDVPRKQHKDVLPARILRRSHPQAAELLLNRYRRYNDEVDKAKEYERDGSVLIVAPDDLCGLDTLSKNYEGLGRMYRKGYAMAPAIEEFIRG